MGITYNPFSLEGKTILVTGASSGIGKETAISCSKMGASVIITARNQERLQETFDSAATQMAGGGNHRRMHSSDSVHYHSSKNIPITFRSNPGGIT